LGHIPNLPFYVPNLTGASNVPKIEQCHVYCSILLEEASTGGSLWISKQRFSMTWMKRFTG
jgi:hypothetical protein